MPESAKKSFDSSYKILSRSVSKENPENLPKPVLILNSEEAYDKNDYINLSEQSSSSSKDNPRVLKINYEDELGIINEESLGKSNSVFSKINEFKPTDKIKEMSRAKKKVMINKQTTQNLLPPTPMSNKVRSLKKSQTKLNADFDVLEIYSDLSQLSSKKYNNQGNESFKGLSKEEENKSKVSKVLKETIHQNQKLSYQDLTPMTNKASRGSKEAKSISSISIHSSINIDSEERKKPIKRFNSNMIQVNNLSE